jgi:putative heme iron utilization protein
MNQRDRPQLQAVELLRRLIAERRTAALATLHRGRPAVSMVPFAHDPAAGDVPGALLIHVSTLATHTRDMQESAEVALLLTAEDDGSAPPQALPRATLSGQAQFIARDGDGYAAARARYLARFAHAAMMFELADFSLVRLAPASARVVGGFAQATSLVGAALQEALA